MAIALKRCLHTNCDSFTHFGSSPGNTCIGFSGAISQQCVCTLILLLLFLMQRTGMLVSYFRTTGSGRFLRKQVRKWHQTVVFFNYMGEGPRVPAPAPSLI